MIKAAVIWETVEDSLVRDLAVNQMTDMDVLDAGESPSSAEAAVCHQNP